MLRNLKILNYFPLIVTVFLMLSISVETNAQLNSDDIVQISEKDGLSSQTVRALIVDNKGYIWAGTPNGLSRYDGIEFQKFYSNPIDSNAIRGMLIYAMHEDRQNRIWLGTNPNFLECYDPVSKNFKTYDYTAVVDPLFGSNPLFGYFVGSVFEDRLSRIFFTVFARDQESRLLYLDPIDDKIKHFNIESGKPFRGGYWMKSDAKGKIWLMSEGEISYIDDDDKLIPFKNLNHEFYQKNSYPIDIAFSNNNHAWFITHNFKLVDYDFNTDQYEIYSSEILNIGSDQETFPSCLTFDKDNNLWIGSNKGLYLFDVNEKVFKSFDKVVNNSKEELNVAQLVVDDFENLWIATFDQGLFKYKKKPSFTSYTNRDNQQNGFPNGWINEITEINEDEIMILYSDGLGLLNLTEQKIDVIRNQFGLNDYSNISTVWIDNDELYFSLFNRSTFRYSKENQNTEEVFLKHISGEKYINKFLKDHRGNKWFATSEGLFRLGEGNSDLEHYNMKEKFKANLASNNVNDLFESEKHGLWIVTDGGLYLYRYETDSIESHGQDEGPGGKFLTQDINSFYEDARGIIWVGTWQGGLARYDAESREVINYNIEDGLSSMSVQAILGDEKNGTLWLSTFNGLSRFDPFTEKFNNFSMMDGIQGNLFSDGAYLKTSNGMFLFGGSNGVTVFNPDQIKTKYYPPKVFLTDFKLNNISVVPGEDNILKKPINETDRIILKYNQNDLSIAFDGIHYSNPFKNKFAYQLENFDPNWREVGRQKEVFYPNLAPGNYVFKLKGANDKGVWTDDNIRLEIHIDPPWWKTNWAYVAYLVMLIYTGYAVHVYQKKKVIRKERERIQKRELEHSREIEKAYTELKGTQAQLIQSEKMASLGELTAGIAHEIQNPLNFVNNFSEVSQELIKEMQEEMNKGELEEATDIANDIEQNLDKIKHHGQRASDIVKSMLQHSSSSSGKKELTDLNALCDEYLRLSYHGLRAKDKSFNADLQTDLATDLPKIEVIPQDFGRVLLNLINNAFYAVKEKSGTSDADFKPTVKVSTKLLKDHLEIKVSDNGNGIPDAIKDKIFQPFFTTKPTGKGTGLGLSLSYDIVKVHGGELTVDSEEGEGTAFKIDLPCT